MLPGLKKYCYLNGRIIPTDRALIHINNIGITRGFGVTDVLKTYHGKVFLLKEHIRRFQNSAKTLGLKIPISSAKIGSVLKTLIAKNKSLEVQIRLVLTGGIAVSGLQFDKNKPTFFILIEDSISLPQVLYRKGGKLITFEHQRFFPTAKTTNYIVAVNLQPRRIKEKAVEILFISGGIVREPSTSNIFMFKGNTLVTPKDKILIGMTHNFVIKLARPFYRVQERDITLKELLAADEVFITATNKEILPIVKIDGKLIKNGKVGKRTQHLMKIFSQKVGSDVVRKL